jgi:hypothetical protein
MFDKARILTVIKDMSNQGYRQKEIARQLNRMGLTTPRGTTWVQSTVSKFGRENGFSKAELDKMFFTTDMLSSLPESPAPTPTATQETPATTGVAADRTEEIKTWAMAVMEVILHKDVSGVAKNAIVRMFDAAQ